MDWTHLKPADGRWMPWKNGGGTTLELAVEPAGATLGTGFAWRVSTADVAASGPFSPFPGLQRTLLLLEGDGFQLDFGDRGTVELRESLIPVAFSGDWPASAALIGGPCRDFNLMVDPTRAEARLEVVRLKRARHLELRGSTQLFFLAQGTLSIPEWGLHLGPRHALRVEDGEGAIHLAPGVGGAALIVVEIRKA